jgi:hypothetical protein
MGVRMFNDDKPESLLDLLDPVASHLARVEASTAAAVGVAPAVFPKASSALVPARALERCARWH